MVRTPPFDRSGMRPGMRLAVAVSGGADSVGLLRALTEAAPEIGLVLSVAHVHHGIRGSEADDDTHFVEDLAQRLGLKFLVYRADTPLRARERRQSLEDAARQIRYAWFWELMAEGHADAVATAHTLDDQAETVLQRLLRGAWTEGLGGIHPVVRGGPPVGAGAETKAGPARARGEHRSSAGSILRPFLNTRRAEIRAWLKWIGQSWREDATNQDTTFTRNRIRHELLPQLVAFNPRIAERLAHLATIARDEEECWETELQRLLPSLVLPGRPVRGGGRAVSTRPDEGAVGMELERLRALAPGVRRRVLRAAAQGLGFALNFEQTERLMAMCGPEGPRREQLGAELQAEKTARELRLVRAAEPGRVQPEEVELAIPGEAEGLGVRVRTRLRENEEPAELVPAKLRGPRAGDRVQLRHSRGMKPLKEIFERMNVEAEARKMWPLVEWEGRVVWMKGVALEIQPPISFTVEMVQEDE